VNEELMRSRAPMKVQPWIKQPPSWLAVVSLTVIPDPRLMKLDAGERDAIILAEELSADQLIVDELLETRGGTA
jgi:predicted nucleic acid-binding protein